MSDSLRPHGLRSLVGYSPWDFPGKSAGVDCHFLLQGIFQTQESSPGLPHCRQMLYRLSPKGSPRSIQFMSFTVSIIAFMKSFLQFSCSVVSDSCHPMDCSTPGLPVQTKSQNLLKLMSIDLVMPSNHLTLCRPLLLSPSVVPSIRVFSNESALRIRLLKYWKFSFNVRPSNEYSGLIHFRMDWLDFFAVQGTLKSLLQHHS